MTNTALLVTLNASQQSAKRLRDNALEQQHTARMCSDVEAAGYWGVKLETLRKILEDIDGALERARTL